MRGHLLAGIYPSGHGADCKSVGSIQSWFDSKDAHHSLSPVLYYLLPSLAFGNPRAARKYWAYESAELNDRAFVCNYVYNHH